MGEAIATPHGKTYGYAPVYAAVPASMASFGIKELTAAGLPERPEITGSDMQVLRAFLQPGEKILAEPGALVYMSEGVRPGCDESDCVGRCISCSPCCVEINYPEHIAGDLREHLYAGCMATFEVTEYGNYVALTPVRPAKVLPVPLGGRRFLAKDRAFFASLGALSASETPRPLRGRGATENTLAGAVLKSISTWTRTL
jgi:hypothetical protein